MLRTTVFALLFSAALQAQERVPVLLELFTSEGCSSCPPADALLKTLDQQQPVANVELIVLSEHVDYWNRLGWKDPYSSSLFSERQQRYADALHSNDVFTPQAIIDGRYSTVGSNRDSILRGITAAGGKAKPVFEITAKREGNSIVVDVPAVASGEIWLALAQDKTISHVVQGENSGRTLQHVGVVRTLFKVSPGQTKLAVDKSWDGALRVVAFLQEPHMGRILQVVQRKL